MSATADLSEQEQVERGVYLAYVAQGYVSGDPPEVDKESLFMATYSIVRAAVVETKRERGTKAVTRGHLMATLFPSVPGPGTDEYATEVGERIWKEVEQSIWNYVKPDHTAKFQKALGAEGGGLVLCRTKIDVDGNPVDAAYVTGNPDLILLDFAAPLKQGVRRAAERMAKNLAMVSNRKPEMARTLTREVDSGMEAASSLARSSLALLTESTGDGGE